MKFSSIVLSLFLLANVGCSSTTQFRGQEPILIKATPPVVVDRDAYTVTFPPHWKLKREVEGMSSSNFTMQVMAKSPDDSPIVSALASVDLTDELEITEENFPMAAIAYSASHLGEIDKAILVTLDGRPASIAFISAQDHVKVIQLATAAGKKGYILRCGGEVTHSELFTTCLSIVDSFHVKK